MEGLLGLVVLILDIVGIINLWKAGVGTAQKVIWTIVILALPVLGLVIWYFAGPKSSWSPLPAKA